MKGRSLKTILAACIVFTLFLGGVQPFVSAACAQEAQSSVALQKTAADYADQQAKEWLAKDIPGLELAVAVDGKLAYSKAFGYKSKEHLLPTERTTKFRIGSISKSLT